MHNSPYSDNSTYVQGCSPSMWQCRQQHSHRTNGLQVCECKSFLRFLALPGKCRWIYSVTQPPPQLSRAWFIWIFTSNFSHRPMHAVCMEFRWVIRDQHWLVAGRQNHDKGWRRAWNGREWFVLFGFMCWLEICYSVAYEDARHNQKGLSTWVTCLMLGVCDVYHRSN